MVEVVTKLVTRAAQPLQVWLPHLGHSFGKPSVRRDLGAAFALLDVHVRCWLSPELKKTYHVRNGENWDLYLRAEHVDCFDIVYASLDGFFWEAQEGAARRVPFKSLDELIKSAEGFGPEDLRWLVPPPKLEISIPVSGSKSGVVKFARRTFPVEPSSVLDASRLPQRRRRKSTHTDLRVSFGAGPNPPVFPEAEQRIGKGVVAGHVVIRHRQRGGDGATDLPLVPEFPHAVRSLFPAIGRIDDAREWLSWHAVRGGLALKDPDAMVALFEAVDRFTSTAFAPQELVGFRPALRRFGEWPQAAAPLCEELGLPLVHSKGEAMASRAWAEAMEKRVEVTRVYGAMGLLWVGLLWKWTRAQDRRCRACGRLLDGRKTVNCGLPSCRKRLATERQRVSRNAARRKTLK